MSLVSLRDSSGTAARGAAASRQPAMQRVASRVQHCSFLLGARNEVWSSDGLTSLIITMRRMALRFVSGDARHPEDARANSLATQGYVDQCQSNLA